MWIIGVDGGGTKCEASLFTYEGKRLATALTGPANLFTNFEGAIHSIEQATSQLLNACQEQHNITITRKDCLISLGCAGGGVNAVKKQFQQWPHQYAHALLNTDVNVSCFAANNAKACALFVIGTGSCLAVCQPNKQQAQNSLQPKSEFMVNIGSAITSQPAITSVSVIKQYGGHGFLLGDIASGAWLGKHAVSWYLQALETPSSEVYLQSALAPVLGDSTSNIIERYGQANAKQFADLVPILLSVQHTSTVVQDWLQQGALYAAGLLSKHVSNNAPIFLSGGLSGVYQPLIEELLGKRVFVPDESAVYGAYLAAKIQF